MDQLDALLAAISSGDDPKAEAAVSGLQALGESAAPELLQLAAAADPNRRWWAVRALAALPTVGSQELTPFLRDGSAEVRAVAALALCNHPDEAAIPALIDALSDADSATAGLAANALTRIGTAAVPALLEFLPHSSPGGHVSALRALAELRDHRAIPVLLQAAQHGSALAQYWAREGLERLGLDMVFLKP